MKNKLLIELIVPEVDEKFDLFIPINKRIGNVITLLNKSVFELTKGVYVGTNQTALYNKFTGERYNINELIINTDIKNGTTLILM